MIGQGRRYRKSPAGCSRVRRDTLCPRIEAFRDATSGLPIPRPSFSEVRQSARLAQGLGLNRSAPRQSLGDRGRHFRRLEVGSNPKIGRDRSAW
jgi:hypothetical protein